MVSLSANHTHQEHGMQVNVISDTVQEFNGIEYTLSGPYFQHAWKHLHVVVWEFHNGPRPDGYHIHHKDENKTNNQPGNLEALPSSEHRALHMNDPERKEMSRQHIVKAQEAASVWHGSEEGKAWHSRHYQEHIAPLQEKMVDLVCGHCGNGYQLSMIWAKNSRYCSNNCKSAARRKTGKDKIKKTCASCRKDFFASKYAAGRTCSPQCAADLRWGRVKPESVDLP
jgi:hypothetical protein